MKYCTECGSPLRTHTPECDDRERLVCSECAHVHYCNPRVIVSCVAEHEGRILLGRRAIEPCAGSWGLPGGYLENDETTDPAVSRECREETGVQIRVESLMRLFTLTERQEVHTVYAATVLVPSLQCGHECLEVRFFRPADIPWRGIAYPGVVDLLVQYLGECSVQSPPSEELG